jgi:hypothetical protein
VLPLGELAGMSIVAGMVNFSLAAILVAALSMNSSRLHAMKVAEKRQL